MRTDRSVMDRSVRMDPTLLHPSQTSTSHPALPPSWINPYHQTPYWLKCTSPAWIRCHLDIQAVIQSFHLQPPADLLRDARYKFFNDLRRKKIYIIELNYFIQSVLRFFFFFLFCCKQFQGFYSVHYILYDIYTMMD